jgi:hypothetical protein
LRRLAACTLVVALGGCGERAEPQRRPDPFVAIEREVQRPRPARAAPRWEPVATLAGRGPGSQTVAIAEGAIQWRVRCSGTVRVDDATCRRGQPAEFIGSGERRLRIAADGPWQLLVEQQVETALREPQVARTSVLARGRFRTVERRTRGDVALYRLPSGRLGLRFTGFRTSASIDLFVWVSRARNPRSSQAVLAAPYTVVGRLKSTLGEQNYVLPKRLSGSDVRSVVIWCRPIRIAYAAAPLRG